MDFFFKTAGAKVNAARLHETPLHHAAKNMRVEMMSMLEINTTGSLWTTPPWGVPPQAASPFMRVRIFVQPVLHFATL